MHESSLGKQILGAVIAKAQEVGATRVRRVVGWVAETEHLDPRAISFHFDALARGTLAEGAELSLRLKWVEARCHDCQCVYKPDHHLLLCPDCGSTEGEVLGETGLGVDSIDIEET